MQSFTIPVCINICCCLYICMSHQFFCHIYLYSGPLEVGAKRMPETIGRQALGWMAHAALYLSHKTVPHTAHTALALYCAGHRRENRRKWLSFFRQEPREQSGVYRDVPDAGGRLGPLDDTGPALLCGVDVNLPALKIHISPCKRGSLSWAHPGIQES